MPWLNLMRNDHNVPLGQKLQPWTDSDFLKLPPYWGGL
jgi:hypothetical protein